MSAGVELFRLSGRIGNRVSVFAGLLALALLIAVPAFNPAASVTSDHPASHGALAASTMALAAARSSIVSGHGPAVGLGPCVSSVASVSCRPAPAGPHPLAGGSSDPVSWTDLTKFENSAPSARYIASMMWDPTDQYVVLFGGYGTGGADSDTWAFANNQWTSLSPSSSPAGRYGTSMAWDTKDGYGVLFGGYNGLGLAHNDTWTFVHGQWTNITTTAGTAPLARWRQQMTYDAADSYVLMYGGTNATATTLFTDTWSFTGGKWSKLTVTGSPPSRYRGEMTYDTVAGVAVIFGGCTSANCPDSTTWTYHNLAWSSVSATTHPSGRVYFGFTSAPVYPEDLLFSGSTTYPAVTASSDTWSYANGTWSQLTSSLVRSPGARAYPVMQFDPLDNYTVMFGGQWGNGTFIGETWGLGQEILGAYTVTPPAIDLGQTAQLNATPFSYSSYVKYDYTQLPTGCTSANVSVLSCQPTTTGVFPLTVVLNDSTGKATTEKGSLAVNTDPAIASFTVTPSAVTVGSKAHFAVMASGGTGSLGYRYTGLPAGCTTANSAGLNCTPSALGAGVARVTVTVTDGAAFTLTGTTTLTVNPTPKFASVVVKPATLDVGQSFTMWANVSGGTGPFTYQYLGLPTGCTAPNAPMLVCTPTVVASPFITVNATDTFGWYATGGTNVTISADPAISSFGASPAIVDVALPVTITVNASGGTGVLTYSYTGGPPGCTLGNRASTTCSPTSVGNYTILATVTDGVGFVVTTTIHLKVNDVVSVTSVSATPAATDAGQSVTITSALAGGTTPFVPSYTGLPAGCNPTSISATAAVVSCGHPAAGTYNIGVSVSDKFKTVSSNGVQLIVYPDPTVSAFTAEPNGITVGTATNLQVAVTGGSGIYKFQYSGLPAGCGSSNTSVLLCQPSVSGTFNVTVTVTDSIGIQTTGSMNLVVHPVSASSAILGLPPTTAYVLFGLIGAVVVAAALILMRMGRKPAGGSADRESSAPSVSE